MVSRAGISSSAAAVLTRRARPGDRREKLDQIWRVRIGQQELCPAVVKLNSFTELFFSANMKDLVTPDIFSMQRGEILGWLANENNDVFHAC